MMWFDVEAAWARMRGEAPSANPASPASSATPPRRRLAGFAGLAGGGAHPTGSDASGGTAPTLADHLDAAEERAAIIEHDGGLPRADAERLALAAVDCPEARRVLRAHWGRTDERRATPIGGPASARRIGRAGPPIPIHGAPDD